MIGDLFDSPWKILIVAVVLIVLFGSAKLPVAARSLGKSMRILKTEVQSLNGAEGESEAAPPPPATATARQQTPAAQQQIDDFHAAATRAEGNTGRPVRSGARGSAHAAELNRADPGNRG